MTHRFPFQRHPLLLQISMGYRLATFGWIVRTIRIGLFGCPPCTRLSRLVWSRLGLSEAARKKNIRARSTADPSALSSMFAIAAQMDEGRKCREKRGGGVGSGNGWRTVKIKGRVIAVVDASITKESKRRTRWSWLLVVGWGRGCVGQQQLKE